MTTARSKALKTSLEYPTWKEWLPLFEKELRRDPSAEISLQKLVREGCERPALLEFLHGHVCEFKAMMYGYRTERRQWKEASRLLSMELTALAPQVERVNKMVLKFTKEWPVGLRLRGREQEKVVSVAFAEYLPSIMRAYARLLEVTFGDPKFYLNQLEQLRGDFPIGWDLPILASYVRVVTKRTCYDELSHLVRVAYASLGNVRDPGPDGIRKFVERYRKKHRSLCRRMEQLSESYLSARSGLSLTNNKRDFALWMYENLSRD